MTPTTVAFRCRWTRRATLLLCSVAAVAVLTGCSDSRPSLEGLTSGDSSDRLINGLAHCPRGASHDDRTDVLLDVTGWVRITDVLDEGWVPDATAASDSSGDGPSLLQVAEASGDGQELLSPEDTADIVLGASEGRSIQWAVEHGVEAWIGINIWWSERPPPDAAVVTLLLPDGRAIFAGDCAHADFYDPLAEVYQDPDEVVHQMVGKVGPDLESVFTGATPAIR